MDARQKAEEGVRLLKEAVLGYVTDHPGANTRQVKDDLGLASPDENDDHEDKLLWGIDNLLRAEGKIRLEKIKNINCRYLVN